MSFFFSLGFDSKRRKCAFLSNRDGILSANERDRCVSRVYIFFLRRRLTRGDASDCGRMLVPLVGGGHRTGGGNVSQVRQCGRQRGHMWHVPKSSSQRSSGGTVGQERSKIIIIVNLRCCHRDAGVETDACHSCSSFLFSSYTMVGCV